MATITLGIGPHSSLVNICGHLTCSLVLRKKWLVVMSFSFIVSVVDFYTSASHDFGSRGFTALALFMLTLFRSGRSIHGRDYGEQPTAYSPAVSTKAMVSTHMARPRWHVERLLSGRWHLKAVLQLQYKKQHAICQPQQTSCNR